MVSHLVFYQLMLLALVWVLLRLSWLWPSESMTARPTTSKPLTPPRKRSTEAKPCPSLTRQPHCDALRRPSQRIVSRLAPRRVASRQVAARAPSTPPSMAVPLPTGALAAGAGWAISRPLVIPAVALGGSCMATLGRATASHPMAPSCSPSSPPIQSTRSQLRG